MKFNLLKYLSYLSVIALFGTSFYIVFTTFAEESQEDKLNNKTPIQKWSPASKALERNFVPANLLLNDSVKLQKFIALFRINDSYNGSLVDPNEIYNSSFKHYYTYDADSANVVILIDAEKEGAREGSYSGGVTAYRKYAEVKYIESKSRKVYKSQKIDYDGSAPEEIKLPKYTRTYKFLFGEYPEDRIWSSILSTCKRDSTLASNR